MALPTEEDLEQCICMTRCPTYVEGDTGLFCVHGESEKDPVERGCFCRTCPVHVKYGLSNRAFCLRGKAEE
jgi:hypothetical protein